MSIPHEAERARPDGLSPSLPLLPAIVLLIAVLSLVGGRARAERGDLEIGATSEATVFSGRSVAATTSDAAAWSPQLRVGYGVTDALTVLLGWRSMALLSRGDSGYDLDTDVEMVVATTRWSVPVRSWFRVDAELDLEAIHGAFDFTVDAHRGTTSSWGFGAVPKVAAVFVVDLDGVELDVRLHAGFALRTDLAADDLHLSGEGESAQRRPLDLGATNLSGAVFGLGVGFVF